MDLQGSMRVFWLVSFAFASRLTALTFALKDGQTGACQLCTPRFAYRPLK